MKIQSLRLKNFLSYGKFEQEVKFTRGLNFIVGPNGSGKTNLVRAIKLIASCMNKYENNLGNLDPEIVLSIELKLSKQEQRLLGQILCISIYKEMEELINKSNFDNFKGLIYREIIEETKGREIHTIYEDNKDLLNLHLPDKEFNQEQKIREQRNQIFANLNIINQYKFKEYIESSDLNINLGILKDNNFYDFKMELLSDELHINVGSLFEIVTFKLTADVVNLIPSIWINLNDEHIQINYDCLKTEYSDERKISVLQLVHDYLRRENNQITLNTLKDSIEKNFSSENAFGINLPNLDVKFSSGDVKDLSVIILEQLKEYYVDDLPSPRLMFIDIIKKLFELKTVVIPEHRGLIPEENVGLSNFTLSELPEILYKWKNSSNEHFRERFYVLQKDFKTIFHMSFDVYITDTTITLKEEYPKLELGDVIRTTQSRLRSDDETSQNIVKWKDLLEEAIERKPFIQFITNENIPLEIYEAPSGAYETLMILTALSELGDKTIIIDEPARALHPQLQKKIVKEIFNKYNDANINPNFVLITHSPYFITDFMNSKIWKCSNGEILDFDVSELTSDDSSDLKNKVEEKALNFLHRIENVSKLLFSNKIILVEGSTDKLLVEELDRAYPDDFKVEENGWDIVELFGKYNLPIAWRLLKKLKVEYFIISDLDQAFQYKNGKSQPFKKSVLGEVSKNFLNNENYKKFANSTYEDLEKNTQLYDDFFQQMLKEGIYVWKVGELENVIESLTGRKIEGKARNGDVLECIKSLSNKLSTHPILQDLVKNFNDMNDFIE